MGILKVINKFVRRIHMEFLYPKLECIGHIQKRVGRKLRKLKEGVFKDLYDTDDDDDDDDGDVGKGKKKKKRKRLWLNDKMINKLQNYYGIAVHWKIDGRDET